MLLIHAPKGARALTGFDNRAPGYWISETKHDKVGREKFHKFGACLVYCSNVSLQSQGGRKPKIYLSQDYRKGLEDSVSVS